jgi:CrcB protein
MLRAALIFLAGGAGSVARYGITLGLQRAAGTDLPVGTLAVNIAGSFLAGLLMTLSLERGVLSNEVRVPLTIGFCGGFTTMSAFSYETLALLRYQSTGVALANVGATLAACLLAVWVGHLLARCRRGRAGLL